MGERELSAKQKSFCREYLIDSNATQAAIRAGYSTKTAAEQGSRLLINVKIKTKLAELTEKKTKRTEITADYVLTGIKEVAERCMQRKPVLDDDGNETGDWKFEHTGANKAFENLGRHLKMFTDKIEEKSKRTVVVKDLSDMSDKEIKEHFGGE